MFQSEVPINSVGLLLAAGHGRRFDPTGTHNKLTQLLANGMPVAVQTAHHLSGAVSRVIAVVSCPKLAQQLAITGCEVHLFSPAKPGMGASLAFGISHIIDSAEDSVLVALADMPYVRTETNRKIVDVLAAGADIAQPVYLQNGQQQSGHPIGFSRRHFPALMTLTGDIGARHLLREFSVHQVAVHDAGILRDIDFFSDL